MLTCRRVLKGILALAGLGLAGTAQANCKGPPFIIPGNLADIEVPLTVKAGTECIFNNVNGVPGALNEVKITLAPKNGRAGVQNLSPFYVPRPGFQGPDEFTYTLIGTNQYGGPIRVSIKRKVTVVSSL